MGFSKEVKDEILSKNIESDCCARAFLSGLINACGVFDIKKSYQITISTDLVKLPSFIKHLIKMLYNTELDIDNLETFTINKTTYSKVVLKDDFAKRILYDTGCVVKDLNGEYIEQNLDEYMINSECCLKSYVAGVFVGCGTSNIKISNETRVSTGYHLEFASKNKSLLSGLGSVLAQFDIFARLVPRKNIFVLYVKDANEVSNVLALIGASNGVLSLQSEMAMREIRNKVNRQTNCMSANISKTVEASMKQINAIEKIIKVVGLENLPQDLQVVALLRLANTEESLDELLHLSKLPLTKSGLNHRFLKLIKFANNLKE